MLGIGGTRRGLGEPWRERNSGVTAGPQKRDTVSNSSVVCNDPRNSWPDQFRRGCVHSGGWDGWLQWVSPQHGGLEGSCDYSPMSSSTTLDAVQRTVSRDAAGILLDVLLNVER